MIYAISDAFARTKQVPSPAQTPQSLPLTALERMHGLIAAGFPARSLAVVGGKLMLISRETDNMKEL
jgi:hypothetical protein